MQKENAAGKRRSLWRDIKRSKYLYLMLLPLLIWLGFVCYAPMYGTLLAFKNFNARLGILGSPWVGLANFQRIFSTPAAMQSIKNTLVISIGRLIFEFPIPILLAIMITEMPGKGVKRIYQTVYTFPHFLSWVVTSNIIINFLASDGAVNLFFQSMGLETIDFLSTPSIFRPLLYITSDWKEMGWAAIIYMAGIAGIDPSLYEAATVDGASRLRQIWHITLPGIRTTISVMFILQVASMMNGGFDQVFNLYNGVVKNVSQILDTYVYEITFMSTPNYGFSTAVGLFKSVINFIMLIISNQVVYKLSGDKMFG